MPKKRLRAAAPRPMPRYAEEEYFAEEPNVKLSRAFVVVLLLHIVAVGGIFAFSALKDRQQPASVVRSESSKVALPSSAPELNKGGNLQVSNNNSLQNTYKVRAGDTLPGVAAQFGLPTRDLELANNLKPDSTIVPGRELIVPTKTAPKPVPADVQKLLDPRSATAKNSSSSPTASGGENKTYQVQRGDNPASIARKFKVNSTDLLRANNIDDPRKLRVGDRLIIPQRTHS